MEHHATGIEFCPKGKKSWELIISCEDGYKRKVLKAGPVFPPLDPDIMRMVDKGIGLLDSQREIVGASEHTATDWSLKLQNKAWRKILRPDDKLGEMSLDTFRRRRKDGTDRTHPDRCHGGDHFG